MDLRHDVQGRLLDAIPDGCHPLWQAIRTGERRYPDIAANTAYVHFGLW
jgi:hypothetical protein